MDQPPMDRLLSRRTVKWGDCDPAGILYTPRVFDYITEAVESWYHDVGGVPWMEMIGSGQGAPTVHTSVDFRTPMEPGLDLAIAVLLEAVGSTSLSFRILGDGVDGVRYFEGRLVSVFIDFATRRPIPIPAGVRGRAEAYAGRHGAE